MRSSRIMRTSQFSILIFKKNHIWCSLPPPSHPHLFKILYTHFTCNQQQNMMFKEKNMKAVNTPTLKKSLVKEVKEVAVMNSGIPVGSFINFGSGMKAPYNKLSNFNGCTITGKIWISVEFNKFSLKEFTFPSSEHLWWSHFLVLEKDVKRIAIGGDLSTIESGLAFFYKGEELEKKIEYWGRKNNVGIVAKLLAGKGGTKYRKRAADLGMKMSIHPCPKYGNEGSDMTLRKIWSSILIAKYAQNEGHRSVLLGTGDHHLVEFTRAPMARIQREFWAGRVESGRLYGKNYMGDCMMCVRDVMVIYMPMLLDKQVVGREIDSGLDMSYR